MIAEGRKGYTTCGLLESLAPGVAGPRSKNLIVLYDPACSRGSLANTVHEGTESRDNVWGWGLPEAL